MPRFAAIDMGSNASRLLIVEADDSQRVRVIEYERVPVRLGRSVFLTGHMEEASLDAAVTALRRFAGRLEDLRVERYRAVVTASAREADNQEELLRRVRMETGLALESVDGTEEARLVQLAVSHRVSMEGKRALLMDLGGGSLEVTECVGEQTRFSVSLEIGTVRLLEAFLGGGASAITTEQETVVREYVTRALAGIAPRVGRKRYDVVIGTGGNLDAIAELCPAASSPVPTIDVEKARALMRRLMKMSLKDRRRVYNLRADRADVIVPALYIVTAMAEIARAGHIVAPGVGLKEGIIYELVDKHFRVWDYRGEENELVHAALQIGRRYQFDEAHATQVERIATRLFDGLSSLHGLGPRDRRALRLATLLHDVGTFVEPSSHHKHTQYIIENSDIMGLTPSEKTVIGCVARYHRRAVPNLRHPAYARLVPADRVRVQKLAAILRLADALDRGHLSKVRELGLALTPKTVEVHLRGHEDMSLESWTLERKAGAFFQSVYRRSLELKIHP